MLNIYGSRKLLNSGNYFWYNYFHTSNDDSQARALMMEVIYIVTNKTIQFS